MKSIKLLLAILLATLFNGCYKGPSTYEVWKKNNDISIGMKLYKAETLYKAEGKKKVYDKNHYIYIIEHPKNCIFGYLVKKNDKKRIRVDWVIISGKEYCKERQATVLIQ